MKNLLNIIGTIALILIIGFHDHLPRIVSNMKNEYKIHYDVKKKIIQIKMPFPTYGLVGLNKLSNVDMMDDIDKKVFKELRRSRYYGITRMTIQICYSHYNKYGNKVYGDWKEIGFILVDEVRKYNEYDYYYPKPVKKLITENVLSQYNLNKATEGTQTPVTKEPNNYRRERTTTYKDSKMK